MISLLLGGDLGPGGALEWTAPVWVVGVGVALALLAWGASLRGERSVVARVGEASLWGGALLGLLFAVARPVWVEEDGHLEPGRVAVLIDASSSMGIEEGDVSRSEAVAGILQHLASELPRMDVYHFGDELQVGPPQEYSQPTTDIEGALEDLEERTAGEQLAGVVLVTDGIDRGLLRRRFQRDERAAPPLLTGPLTIFQVGTRTDLRDLAVRSIDSGGYAFLRSPFHIKSVIQGTGFEKQTVEVSLLQDSALVKKLQVTLDQDGRAEVDFQVIPPTAGRFAYEVRVPHYEGDAVRANNVLPVVVRVVRDKIRVLQVAGAPSWDVKFLRRFLKGDPSVDLVSFFILRTNRDLDGRYKNREMSLISFPYRDLFSTDLWSFDAVIFQNFDYDDYFRGEGHLLLDNLRRYVEEDGGSVVMVGGDRSFGLGKYANTPLEKVLPVEVSNHERPSPEAFQPQLTQQGRRHPVTRLAADPTENASWWGRMHNMDGTNLPIRAKEDAVVLLNHPTLQDADGKPLPILTVREAGRGRTMALTVDSSWRWSMSEAAEGRGNQAYLRFWKNSLRWLMRDSSTSRITVETPRENYAVGDEVRLIVRAKSVSFAPLGGADVVAEVRAGGKTTTLDGQTTTSGDVVLSLPAALRGTHKVKVTVSKNGEAVGVAHTVYAVTARDPELDEVAPDPKFLAQLAARVDGRYHPPGELGAVLTDPTAGRMVASRSEVAIWRAPLVGLWISLLSGLAWIVRRRSGLA